MKSAILYMLITVTGQGDVYHSNNYSTLHMCQEAKNIALHGKSIEKEAADKAKAEADRKAHAEKWAKDHPPRKAATEEEKAYVEREKIDTGATITLSAGCHSPSYHVTKDLLIQDDDPEEASGCREFFQNSSPPIIKYAECVRQDK